MTPHPPLTSRREQQEVPEGERLQRLFTGTGAPLPAEVVSGLAAVSTQGAIAQFRESGFLVVEDAFSPSEVASALNGIADIAAREVTAFNERMDHPEMSAELSSDADNAPSFYENRESMIYYEKNLASDSAFGSIPPIRKLNGFIAFEPRLALLADNAGRAAATLLAAETAMLFQDMALLKPASVGSEKPWHQDHAYFNAELGTRIVGCWIALDPATENNGCMRVLRGGHRMREANGDDKWQPCPRMHYLLRDWQICDSHAEAFPRSDVVVVPVSPGSLIFFDGLLPHGTPANQSLEPRRAVQFHYAQPGADGCSNARRVHLFDGTVRGVRC